MEDLTVDEKDESVQSSCQSFQAREEEEKLLGKRRWIIESDNKIKMYCWVKSDMPKFSDEQTIEIKCLEFEVHFRTDFDSQDIPKVVVLPANAKMTIDDSDSFAAVIIENAVYGRNL
jgi:hypothetical protein